ncbi:MAG TPA: MarR family transcriptional regulator [Streptosporangiaceae bacterium]|jgi:DNA-binding MarR family transcriptional regulator
MPATEPGDVAAVLFLSIGVLVRRLRQLRAEGDLTLPETSVLRRLERCGPAAVTALARAEQISVQSIGSTLAALERRGMIERHSDPADGRRAIMHITETGLNAMSEKRNVRIERLARALSEGFAPDELAQLKAAAPLIERLAASI